MILENAINYSDVNMENEIKGTRQHTFIFAIRNQLLLNNFRFTNFSLESGKFP